MLGRVLDEGYRCLFAPERSWHRVVSTTIAALILLNVIAVVIETERAVAAALGVWLFWIEIVSVSVFAAEYLARVVVVGRDPRYRGLLGRVRYVCSPMALLDLCAILPSLMPLLVTQVDLRLLRLLRLLRILAFLRIGRYSAGLRLIGRVFVDKRGELLATLGIVLTVLFLASSVMYIIESEHQEDHFGSIPRAMWWGVITLTTVGYGDATPITPLGQVIGGLIALLGVGLAAMPAGIIAGGIVEQMNARPSASEGEPADDEPADDEAAGD